MITTKSNPLLSWELTSEWTGWKNPIKNPSWEQVEQTLKELNGKDKSMVALTCSNRTSLIIGGGSEDHYVVSFVPADAEGEYSFQLADLASRGPDIPLVVSQPGEYPARWCIGLPLVLEVVKKYFESGQRPHGYVWEKDR